MNKLKGFELFSFVVFILCAIGFVMITINGLFITSNIYEKIYLCVFGLMGVTLTSSGAYAIKIMHNKNKLTR